MSNFLRTESEKILMEALKSSDNSSGRNILRDDDDSWYKIPYQITFGEKFNTVKEDILFRTQNLTGIDGVNNIGVHHPESINSSFNIKEEKKELFNCININRKYITNEFYTYFFIFIRMDIKRE